MPKFRALMVWTDAWIADTHHLTYAERGAYLDLLILMWRTPGCTIPHDDNWLTKHLQIPLDVLRPIIKEFCSLNRSGRLYQKRLLREYRIAGEIRQNRHLAAKLRWRKEKKSTDAMLSVSVSESKKKESNGMNGYAFECGIVRLNQKNLDQWKNRFRYIDLEGALTGLAPWAATQSNWFVACSAVLAKKNQEAFERQQPKVKAPPDPWDAIR